MKTTIKIAMMGVCACVGMMLSACGKKEAAPAPPSAASTPPAAASVPPPAAAASAVSSPASLPKPLPAASSDPDNPTPLSAKEIKGGGIKEARSYYYLLNAGAGVIKLVATAKNAPSGATNALASGLYDLKANKLCADSHGNTTADKTITLNCTVDRSQPLILRLDISEETIDYAVTLDGPVEFPPPQAPAAANTIAGAGSTDIDEPTRLNTNRIKGDGVKKPVSYYYAFNAGPGELTVTADGKNLSAAVTNALAVGLYTLRSERLCNLSLGNATIDKRELMSCKLDKRQPVILRLDLSTETIDYRVKFEGPHDFNEFTLPAVVTIALDSAVLFDTGKASLKPEARQTLHEAAERVKKFADATVMISGHTDNVGNDAANQALSEKRASAVRDYFTGQEAVAATALTVKGYGKSQPVADNTTEEGRSRNRRVDVVITPRQKERLSK